MSSFLASICKNLASTANSSECALLSPPAEQRLLQQLAHVPNSQHPFLKIRCIATFALPYKIPSREEEFCFGSQLHAIMAKKPSVVKQLKSWWVAWYVAEITHITVEQEAEQETQKG